MTQHITLSNREIGSQYPCFIIAELSGNHKQNIQNAYALIDAAVEAQVDAVKLQTYTADTLTIDCDNKWFRLSGANAWAGQTLHDLYKTASTPWEWHKELIQYGQKKGMLVFSTPFDTTAVDFLETLDVPLYKISSFEIGDPILLKRIAQTRKPVIISRGLASKKEIADALQMLRINGTNDIAVLHCVSSYPAIPEEMNLSHIQDIRERFGVVSGLSDHSTGTQIPEIAVGIFGASIIEKHFTLNRKDGGPDSSFSLEPQEMKHLVTKIRTLEESGYNPTSEEKATIEIVTGIPSYEIGPKEKENIVFKRSLFVVEDIKKGETFSPKNIRIIRPGYGLAPKQYEEVIGKKASQDIKRGTPLSFKLIV